MEKKEKNINQNFDFKLTGIELVSSNLYHPGIVLKEKPTFHFNVKIEQTINIENKLIIIASEIEIQHEDKKTIFGSVKVACVFFVANIDDFINKEEELITLSNQVTTMLNSISLSTTRGVMFSQFRGTILHNAFLPIIDPKKFEKSIPGKKLTEVR